MSTECERQNETLADDGTPGDDSLDDKPGCPGTAWQPITTDESYRNYFDLGSDPQTSPVTAPQLGGSSRINLQPGGLGVLMAVINNGALWTCQQVGLDGTDGDYDDVDATGVKVDRSGVQWIRLTLSEAGVQSTAHGRIYDNSENDPWWYYHPSVMANQAGDMVAGFSGSKTNAYMSAFAASRRANGTLNGPVLLKAGTSYYQYERAGDYSYTTLDPDDPDDLTFWTVQQYALDLPGGYDDRWGTWIGRIELEP